MNLLETLAQELYDNLVDNTRNDGSEYVGFADCSPAWVNSAVYEAHDGMLPDDRMFELCQRLAGLLCSTDPEQWDEMASELADSTVDVYNRDLIDWLGSHNSRAEFVNQAISELGGVLDTNIFQLLQRGQYEEAYQTINTLIRAIRKEAEEREDEEDQGDDEPTPTSLS